MPKEFIETGRVVGTHGVKGEIRVEPWCDSPQFILQFKKLFLEESADNYIKIINARVHGSIIIMKVDGVDTIEQAENLRGKLLYINRADALLEEDQYFVQDLLGCKVFDCDTNEYYGNISDVSATGANDVWHITKESKDYLVPVIDDVVISVNIEDGVIRIRPLKGLFDDED